GLQPGDAPVAVLAEDQAALSIHQQAVGTLLPSATSRASRPARLEEDTDALAVLPLEHRVTRDVREEEPSLSPVPNGSLGPVESLGDPFDSRIARHEPIEARVQPLDRAQRRTFG